MFLGRRAFFEFFNPAGRVDEILLARVKRVAIRTDFHVELLFGATGRESIAAGANHLGIGEISWMDTFFHNVRIVA